MKQKLNDTFWLFFPIVVGGIIGFLTSNEIDYQTLVQPPLAPPSIVFPIAWSILYLLIGIAYFLFRKKSKDSTTIFIYYLQLFFNYLWTMIFFVLKQRFFSVLWIITLLLLIVINIFRFYRYHKLSAYLMIPYFLWGLFATYLNIGIYLLN